MRILSVSICILELNIIDKKQRLGITEMRRTIIAGFNLSISVIMLQVILGNFLTQRQGNYSFRSIRYKRHI